MVGFIDMIDSILNLKDMLMLFNYDAAWSICLYCIVIHQMTYFVDIFVLLKMCRDQDSNLGYCGHNAMY